MKPLTLLRRGIAPLLLAVALGCGGHYRSGSGGASSDPNAALAALLADSTLDGTFTVPDGSGVVAKLAMRLKDGAGVVTMMAGEPGTESFSSYSASLTRKQAAAVLKARGSDPGDAFVLLLKTLVDFQSSAFSLFNGGSLRPNPPALGSSALTGTLSGTSSDGAAVSSPVDLKVTTSEPAYDLTGPYTGTITVGGGTQLPWSGTYAASGKYALAASILTSQGTIAVAGAYTHNALSGSFDPAPLGYSGGKGSWYVSADSATTVSGGITVVDAQGHYVVLGKIVGKKGTSSGGGGAANLSQGLYNGTYTPDGGVANTLYLDVSSLSAISGHNGAMVMLATSTANVGGRVDTVDPSGGDVVVTVKNLTSAYSQVVFRGKVGLTNGYAGDFTATRTGGGTVTGSFSTNRVSQPFHPAQVGTFDGGLDSDFPSGLHSDYTATLSQVYPDEITFAPSGLTIDGADVPTITAYYAGGAFVGRATLGATTLDLTGNPETETQFAGGFLLTRTRDGVTTTDSGHLTGFKE